ncbi:proline dehydrogenase [Chloroflexia bacterium SDU3-3]|nr:proline dehydrogenase [Chloroflexia bacterium SDU3-3]
MLRGTLLYLSEQPSLKRLLESPLTKPLINRFVAGTSLAEAIEAVKTINSAGMSVTLDNLGESVSTPQAANAAAAEYIGILHAIERAGAEANASVKLTQMGQDIDEELCRRNISHVLNQAERFGTFVRLDMESSAYTERTLKLHRELWERYKNVGVVIQSYLYRSEDDIRALNKLGVRVRLCKGAYKEPASVAFPNKADVDANYVKLMQMLLSEGTYPGIATHDERMIEATRDYAAKSGITPDKFEFQMLFGIRRDLQEQLVRDGYRMRIYAPYGTEWYPYLMRRMAERPANMLFVLNGVLRDL